jgi:transcriptional regulator with XRE-family HTH domain
MDTPIAAKKRLAERVRSIRTRQRLSQEAVAHQSGLAISFYSSIERAGGNPSLDSLVKLANGLKVPLSELVAGEELERFAQLNELLRGIPASRRVLVLKVFADVVSLLKERERTARARPEDHGGS